MATKVTFTVDDATVVPLRERRAMLRTLDEFFARPGKGDKDAVDKELLELREIRRAGGRRHGC